jgi:hypothetical protein
MPRKPVATRLIARTGVLCWEVQQTRPSYICLLHSGSSPKARPNRERNPISTSGAASATAMIQSALFKRTSSCLMARLPCERTSRFVAMRR